MSCSYIERFLEEDGSVTGDESNDPGVSDDPIPATLGRVAGKYSFLVINEGNAAGSLSSVFVCALDSTGDCSASFLQIPFASYINNGSSYYTLASLYSGTYAAAVADGVNADTARVKAIEALRSVIVSAMRIQVDYYVCFTPSGLSNVAHELGGIKVVVPFAMTLSNGVVLSPGERTVDGNSVGALVTYSGFSSASQNDIYKIIYAALVSQARSVISNSNISLFAIEMRGNCVTDLPSSSGEDVFFLRKLLSAPSESVRFSGVPSQGCGIPTGFVYVINRSGACSQISSFLALYTNEDFSSFFDPDKVLTDVDNRVVDNLYATSMTAPPVYSMPAIVSGILQLTV